MNILITGASGYIGSALVERYQEEGDHELFTVDVKPLPEKLRGSTEHINADLTEFDELKEKLKDVDPDVIFHLAALVRGEAPAVIEANVLGTSNILEVARKKNPKLVIVTSTAGQLYRNAQYVPIDERHSVSPVTPYGISKHLVENLTNYHHRVHGLPTLIFRQSNVYGPSPNPKSTVINKFIEKVKEDGELTIFGDGTQARNFIYIEDLLEFYQKAANTEKPKVLAGETMNIGGPEEYQIKEVARTVKDMISEKEISISSAPPELPPEKDIYLFNLSTEKAESLLDYKARTTLQDGITKMLESDSSF